MSGLGVWGVFFLKLFVILAGIYVIIIITPKLAAFIDKRRKNIGAQTSIPDTCPEKPRPERERLDDKEQESESKNNDNE